MALNHMTLAEMVGVTLPWVTPGKQRSLFLSVPEIAGLMPVVEQAHAGVLGAQPNLAGMSPEVRAILEEEEVVDIRHDCLARGGNWILEGHRQICLGSNPPDAERAALCARVLRKLFPQGLKIVTASFVAESGNTARVAQLLETDAEIKPLLKSIPVRKGETLLDVVLKWIEEGATLGALEDQRTALAAESAVGAPANDKAPKAGKTQAARSAWINAVNLVLGALAVSSAPAQAIEALRHRAVEVSEKAYRRSISGGKDEVEPGASKSEQPAEEEASAKPAEGDGKTADGKKPVETQGKTTDGKKPSGKNEKPVDAEPD